MRVEGLPQGALDAAAAFHSDWLSRAREALHGSDALAVLFAPAPYDHRGWQLAAVQDLAREAALQAFIREAIERGLVASVQDVSGGGLAVALAEAAIWSGRGANVRVSVADSPAVELFGESPSRLVVTTPPRFGPAFALLAASTACRWRSSAWSAATG